MMKFKRILLFCHVLPCFNSNTLKISGSAQSYDDDVDNVDDVDEVDDEHDRMKNAFLFAFVLLL